MNKRSLALVTCGPSYSQVDSVRRLTNFSTGELGGILSETLEEEGWEVVCFRGEGATAPVPSVARVEVFTTNAVLEGKLRRWKGRPAAVFHAAALCDFEVARPVDGKLRSDHVPAPILLKPARKLLDGLRGLFPLAWIAGWKYEVDGTREDALARGRSQLARGVADACVVNGPAYGPGFGVLRPRQALRHLPDKQSLARFLAETARRNTLRRFSTVG